MRITCCVLRGDRAQMLKESLQIAHLAWVSQTCRKWFPDASMFAIANGGDIENWKVPRTGRLQPIHKICTVNKSSDSCDSFTILSFKFGTRNADWRVLRAVLQSQGTPTASRRHGRVPLCATGRSCQVQPSPAKSSQVQPKVQVDRTGSKEGQKEEHSKFGIWNARTKSLTKFDQVWPSWTTLFY